MEITMLPKDCISHIISFTSPRDACRFSMVSPFLRSAADSDAVWECFLPPDHKEILSKTALASSMDFMSKKELYFHLCEHPVVMGNGNLSFGIDRESGKKCYMLGARRLQIIWGNTQTYWQWISLPGSRFSEVAELKEVWWLHIVGHLETKILSSDTTYLAYFVYKFADSRYGFQEKPVELEAYFEGQEVHGGTRCLFLDTPMDMPQMSHARTDGWMEIEMGEFFNDHGQDFKVICCLKEIDNYNRKFGLIVEGIEFRPKDWRT